MSCGVKKLKIGHLSPDINNALIIAVIIAKQNLKTFISKKDSEERGVWNFTLRDSQLDTINATIWGSSKFAKYTYEMFKVGDVVEILNPRISFKQPDNTVANFNPLVTSPFHLQLQESSSNILLYSEDDHQTIKDLIRVQTKAPGDFLRLSDVFSYGHALKGDYVNLLVAIRNIGEIKMVRSKKDFKDLLCRHITVMDQSQWEFHLTLWNEEIIRRADHWQPRLTVLFFADVRLEWSDFRNRVTAIITSRTVITENPNTNEANALKAFAKTAPIQPTAVLEHFANKVIDASRINTVMTTAQVLDKAYNRNNLDDQFTALIFATVTKINLDGCDIVTEYTCSRCSQILDDTGKCLNTECLISPISDYPNAKISFNLRINLTDHRGTLNNCRLTTPAADGILGCSVSDFQSFERILLSNKDAIPRLHVFFLISCSVDILYWKVFWIFNMVSNIDNNKTSWGSSISGDDAKFPDDQSTVIQF